MRNRGRAVARGDAAAEAARASWTPTEWRDAYEALRVQSERRRREITTLQKRLRNVRTSYRAKLMGEAEVTPQEPPWNAHAPEDREAYQSWECEAFARWLDEAFAESRYMSEWEEVGPALRTMIWSQVQQAWDAALSRAPASPGSGEPSAEQRDSLLDWAIDQSRRAGYDHTLALDDEDDCSADELGYLRGKGEAFKQIAQELLGERPLRAHPSEQPHAGDRADVALEALRADGWMVAAHNDYRQDGEAFTFWLLTKGDRCVKGEGRTDAEAFSEIRAALRHGEGENDA